MLPNPNPTNIDVPAPDKELLTELKHLPKAFSAAENLPKTSLLPHLDEKLEPWALLLFKLIIGEVDDPLYVLVEAGTNGLINAELLKPSGHLSS